MKNEYIYGFHGVESAVLSDPQNVEEILLASNRQDKRLDNFLQTIKSQNITIKYVKNLEQITGTSHHQGIAARITPKKMVSSFKELLAKLDSKETALVLALDGITDVHNFGAIIRSADCFGVDAIVIPKNNSASINNPIVAKTSSGAINNVPLITVNNLSQAMQQLKEHNFWVSGTALAEGATNLFEFKCPKKLVWVMGSEGSGMRRLITENCDYLITIPMQGKTQSLNVSVAAGVVLAYTRFSINS